VTWHCHTVVVVGVCSGRWGGQAMVAGGGCWWQWWRHWCAYEGGRKGRNRLPVSEYEQLTCWFRVGLLDLVTKLKLSKFENLS
jgi:hypothetical protein